MGDRPIATKKVRPDFESCIPEVQASGDLDLESYVFKIVTDIIGDKAMSLHLRNNQMNNLCSEYSSIFGVVHFTTKQPTN
jgi:hypothetical protein